MEELSKPLPKVTEVQLIEAECQVVEDDRPPDVVVGGSDNEDTKG